MSVYNKAILKNMRVGISMNVKDSKELKERKRPGPKPKTPEEKAAAAAERAAAKARANNLKPEIFMQYQGDQTDMDTLLEAAKADFRSIKNVFLLPT